MNRHFWLVLLRVLHPAIVGAIAALFGALFGAALLGDALEGWISRYRGLAAAMAGVPESAVLFGTATALMLLIDGAADRSLREELEVPRAPGSIWPKPGADIARGLLLVLVVPLLSWVVLALQTQWRNGWSMGSANFTSALRNIDADTTTVLIVTVYAWVSLPLLLDHLRRRFDSGRFRFAIPAFLLAAPVAQWAWLSTGGWELLKNGAIEVWILSLVQAVGIGLRPVFLAAARSVADGLVAIAERRSNEADAFGS